MRTIGLVFFAIIGIGAVNAQSESVRYRVIMNGNETGYMDINRAREGQDTVITMQAKARFRVIFMIDYDFSARSRFGPDGNAIESTSFIQTFGQHHETESRNTRGSTTAGMARTRRPGREWRTLSDTAVIFNTLSFFNPTTVQRYFRPGVPLSIVGLDMEKGTVRNMDFVITAERDSSGRAVLRAEGSDMQFIFDANSGVLLSNTGRELGIAIELRLTGY